MPTLLVRSCFALVLIAAASACSLARAEDAKAHTGKIEIVRAGSRAPTKGPIANFSGNVMVTPLFKPSEHTRAGGVSVAFEAGARSAWHSHPAGQTLIVTAGTGWVQQWGGEKQKIDVADVIWTPPGVKHWHGATATTPMTHTAIQEQVEGKFVEWMEKVSDAHFLP